MIAEVDEQPTDDVWISYDSGSAATVCHEERHWWTAIGEAATGKRRNSLRHQGSACGNRGYELQFPVESCDSHRTNRAG